MPDDRDNGEKTRPRPFWSGTIAFGLVSLPVSLFPGNRGPALRLRMVDQDGTPLNRRYFCTKEDKVLDHDDLVRGYAVDEHEYVVVQDEELEALAPEKSREIDLRRFVALTDIDPAYFQRTYFLTPDEDTTKAYRLLAKSMEDEQRAGIASLVMRGKEYLVAIIAEKGILRAETLRFHDELRAPEDVGLPEPDKADKSSVRKMRQAMKALSKQTFDRETLSDQYAENVEKLAEKKLKAGKDVIQAAPDEAEEYEEDNVIDLMQILKERLQGHAPRAEETGRGNGEALAELSKDELYRRAQESELPGRSSMSKQELVDALSKRR